jgi:NAD(P)-dependent dehydrogenase (short-subunit alcohol dehydrogenase family)
MPGLTLTDDVVANMPDDVRQRVGRETPGGQLLPPAAVASAIVFLCSDANTGITGEIVRVSAGWR